ncbi:MAG: hypothetical protein OXL34_10480 [Gemmatimonadota bacterium]|nr:hypothetical protein [Gemmatimonadota bacterium]
MADATTPKATGDPKAGGVVFDIGYQRYSGPREGRRRARLAVYKDGFRKVLGLGRGAKAKLLPWACILIMVGISIVMAAMVGFGQRTMGDAGAELVPGTSHYFYYSFFGLIILFVFAALVAPRLLCPDRRNGTLHLYLVRPLTATDYVQARWAACLTVMVLVAWLPQFVLLAGRVLGHPEPLTYLDANWTDIPKFLLAGAAIGAMVTTVSMLASGIATRRGYASVLLIALFVIPNAVTAPFALNPELRWVSVFSLGDVLGETNKLIFNGVEQAAEAGAQVEQPFGELDLDTASTQFSPSFLLAAYFGWLVLPGGILWMYYRRLTL